LHDSIGCEKASWSNYCVCAAGGCAHRKYCYTQDAVVFISVRERVCLTKTVYTVV